MASRCSDIALDFHNLGSNLHTLILDCCYFVQELGTFGTKVFAAISVASVGIINTTGVVRKGNGFRQAQRHLKAETIRFSAGKSSIEDLAKAFAEAESMIGYVEIKIRDSSNS
ncbi:hypothetical protein [Nostoc sp.]|uniref:hypothetical protein n=2 Tax=Nostoc TaxID=1177 RepID=UPI002FFB3280